jgi:large subunit ribosomal protein L19
MNLETSVKNKLIIKNQKSINYIDLVESRYKRVKTEKEEEIKIGDILRVGYLIPEGNKERTQYYEGLVIAKNNRGLGKSFTIRRNVQGIGVEQVFLFNSPKIVSIIKKQSSKVRRAKLYFIRSLSGKATRLKAKL